MMETILQFLFFTSEIICDNTLQNKSIGYDTKFWEIL